MVLEKVKLYLDGTMLRFESDDPDFKTRSIPTGRVEVEEQGTGFVFTDVVHETLICSVDSFDDVLDAAGATYGADLEAVIVALNAFLNFKTGGGGGNDTNFANQNLTFTADREHDASGNALTIQSISNMLLDMVEGEIFASDTLSLGGGDSEIELGLTPRIVSSNGVRFEMPSTDTLGKVLAVTNLVDKRANFVTLQSLGALIAPIVADEDARNTAYPSPTNGQKIFNSRTQEIETFNSTFGIWLSATKKVAIIETALEINRFIYVSGSFTVGGVAYPTLSYPTNGAEDNQTFGVILEQGQSIDTARSFVSVAVGNQHFVEYGEAIAVGEYVSAKITGANADLGFAAGNSATSGRAAIALQNSGATIGKPSLVLVQLNLLAESF